MPIFEIAPDAIRPLQTTRFADAGLQERADLQRLLRDHIDVIADDVLVIAEEFGEWTESRRRIDLLAVDKQANLVVIELKRTEDGGHMELQALRYAAMVSAMTAERAVDVYQRYLDRRRIEADAEKGLLAFLEWDEMDEEAFGQEVRILLVSADFSRELTTSVMWLNERDVDIRCVRMRPYEHEGRTLINVQQVIPLPEAEDYMVGVREKVRRERETRRRDLTKFDLEIDGQSFERLPKRRAIFELVRGLCRLGHSPEEIWAGVSGRSFGRTWRRVDGVVDADEFDRQADDGGSGYDPHRWFNAPDELIVHDGNTYAFHSGWGIRTEATMRGLIDAFGEGKISLIARR